MVFIAYLLVNYWETMLNLVTDWGSTPISVHLLTAGIVMTGCWVLYRSAESKRTCEHIKVFNLGRRIGRKEGHEKALHDREQHYQGAQGGW